MKSICRRAFLVRACRSAFLDCFMKRNLVLNSFTKIFAKDEQGIIVSAPNPQSGLQKLKISKSEEPNLYELFLELSEIGFNYFDCEKDINKTEFNLLFEYGFLVEPEKVPEKPLFACFLEDIEKADFDGDDSALIVNPSFSYEPFSLINFLPWANELHFSPHKASAWIKQPVTEIEIGYWLDNDQARTVSNFKAGEKPPFELEKDFLSKLVACNILTTPETLAEKERAQIAAIEKARIKYQSDKYAVLQKILPAEQMRAMRRFYREYVAQGFMPFEDSQSRRFYQHNEPLARYFHCQLAPLMSLVIGEEVIPSYVYAASYINEADLKPHTDRAQCEFSISFQVDYLPEPENHRSPWGLFVKPPDFPTDGAFIHRTREFPANSEAEDENTAVYLASGEGLVYKGCELVHYRYPLTAGHQSTSLFFHYVPVDFEGNLN